MSFISFRNENVKLSTMCIYTQGISNLCNVYCIRLIEQVNVEKIKLVEIFRDYVF